MQARGEGEEMKLDKPFLFNGYRIKVVPEFVERRRSLRERLFSWPWRPLVRTRVEKHPLFDALKHYVAVDHVNQVAYMRQNFYDKLRIGQAGTLGTAPQRKTS